MTDKGKIKAYNKLITRSKRALKETLKFLEKNVPCTFWACEGPDKPFVHMQTCSVCQEIQHLRQEIKDINNEQSLIKKS